MPVDAKQQQQTIRELNVTRKAREHANADRPAQRPALFFLLQERRARNKRRVCL